MLALLLGGCLPPPDLLAQRVWDDYGMPGTPPEVSWRHDALDCRDGRGWSEPSLNGQCVAGATWTDTWFSEVASWPGATLEHTALAHELNHARLWIQTGNDDPQHLDPSFHTGGLVPAEEARLAGLPAP